MKQALLDQTKVTLEAYEPAGTSIELTSRDLLGHSLVLGGSGAGKTTCIIQPLVAQLLKEPNISFCLLDSKADGEADSFIRKAAFKAERDKNLSIISLETKHCLDLLEPLRKEGIDGATKLAETLGYLVPECSVNRYWEVTFRALLRHALRLFLLLDNEITYSGLTQFIADYLLRFETNEGSFKNLEMLLETLHEDGKIDAPEEGVHEARSMHQMWEKLDWRTRTNLQSMTAPLVSLLNSKPARQLFAEGEAVSIKAATDTGGIVLLSVDSVREPEVATMAGTLLKARYYDAIFQRKADPSNPLSLLVLDDWIQSANHGTGTRYSDADALALIRSRNGGILAAAQGIAGLDLAIGPYSRRATLANFANLFFFRSRDQELDAIAAAYLGQKTETLKDTADFGQMTGRQKRSAPVEYQRQIRVPAVPQGALARLPTGEAYALIGGKAYCDPISFIPYYETK